MRRVNKMRFARSCLLFLLVIVGHCFADKKPNIVFILTDDQDLKLGSLEFQPKVRSLLTEQGLTFNNAFVSTPVCCPSRSSILTGKYVHNHRAYENNVPSGCNAPSWRALNEHKTMGAYMSRAGYKTGLFGKYINNYAMEQSGVGVEHIPPGWDKWFGLKGNSKYYQYSVSNDGVEEVHGNDYATDYFTDVVKREAVQFIKNHSDVPLFAYISTPAPHRPATPAPQYASMYSDKVAPRTPSYGVAGYDKHWLVSVGTPPLTPDTKEAVDDLYRDRIRTLLSVDDLVEAVVTTLQEEGILDNTYIFYTSDHGYHLGQFNQQGEKRQPYDENIRIPFIVKGPGVPANMSTGALALSIDLAPTFMDLGGLPVADDMDGESLKPVLLTAAQQLEEEDQNYQFLIEYYGENGVNSGFIHDCHNNTFLGIRVADSSKKEDFIYTQFYLTDSFPVNASQLYFKEYYDLNQDYWEMTNLVQSLSIDEIKEMQRTIDSLYSCSGQSCRDMRKRRRRK